MKKSNLITLLILVAVVLVTFSSCRKDGTPVPEDGPQEIEAFLKSIPRVSSVQKLEDDWEGFESAWQLKFVQPLDHFDESVKYRILQRVYVHFKSFDAPVVFYGSGYEIMNIFPDI